MASTISMQVKRLRPTAVMPVRGSVDAAGFDLAASEAVVVPASGKAIVKTGLSIAIPQETYARIAPRSGLAAKKMIHCGAGVVDYDYRGEVGVVLFNHGSEDFAVAPGDRVAQLILEKIAMCDCVEVQELAATARGAGGFGSTGVAGAAANAEAPGGTPTKPNHAELTHPTGGAPPEKAAVSELLSEVRALRAQVSGVDTIKEELQRLQEKVKKLENEKN